ncbi:peptidylprolyl isomerase [Rhodoferax antarcticus]|uniref:peptidylprolyl isomerase n=1 Tax=Rhodoferax antarcticus TaxID=81479 RepID=UPI00222432EA|nr:peptidylprolyl isomerase [Rhodoferax antarcticus]MCW2311132.1 peptidyl-prolyl cis-trans isomerase SurA [Rhodoferax antarcticus]
MTHRLKTFTVTMLALAASLQAQAQGLSLPANRVLAPVASPAQSQADYIVAVVNSEPITNREVYREAQREYQQLVQQRRAPPDVQALLPEILEGLINRKAQLQLARDTGLRVEESAIDQAEQSIAVQNQVDVAELRLRVTRDGMSVIQFRDQLSDQILMQRLRERDVESRVRITEQDIDQFLREQPAAETKGDTQINLAQILIAVPEVANAQQVDALKLRAQRALERARKGEDFATLVREFSDATDLANAGQLGLRSTTRYPELFVRATTPLSVGDVAELVRSPAGFHVLKVVEKIRPGLPTMAVTQSHARHILLVPNARLSEAEARSKLAEFKKQVVTNQSEFATLARQNSQDGSAALGGDLGWASPGMFVPEFEATMNRLAPGEVSDPLLSRFGVHLIQLLERRKATLTTEQQREAVRAMLREKKLEEAYQSWAQDVRARAYVELREPPV